MLSHVSVGTLEEPSCSGIGGEVPITHDAVMPHRRVLVIVTAFKQTIKSSINPASMEKCIKGN